MPLEPVLPESELDDPEPDVLPVLETEGPDPPELESLEPDDELASVELAELMLELPEPAVLREPVEEAERPPVVVVDEALELVPVEGARATA